MLLLVQDFAWFSLIFRALQLVGQTFLVGCIFFLVFVRPESSVPGITQRLLVWIKRLAGFLVFVVLGTVASDSFVLMISVGLPLSKVMTAEFFITGIAEALLASAIFRTARQKASTQGSVRRRLLLGLAVTLLAANTFTTHSVSRVEHGPLLAVLTFLHQAAASLWLGSLAALLLTLRASVASPAAVQPVVRRFTPLAITGCAVLLLTGISLSVFYIGSAQALYGTAYGVMVASKAVLLLILAGVGALNFRSGRAAGIGSASLSLLRRFSEVEVLIAFSVLVLAASLTSQPPGSDMVQNRLTRQEFTSHFHPVVPILQHPPVDSLAPATSPQEAARRADDAESIAANSLRDPDEAWNDYVHHWAGIFTLSIGILGVLANFKSTRWARYWPLLFLLLSAFLMVVADPENWPLGPVSYWQSFSDPEVLLHRLLFFMLVLFGIFETGVQVGRYGYKAAMIFPSLMFLAGCALVLHNHTLGNVKAEVLAELSHLLLAVFAIASGTLRMAAIGLSIDRDRLPVQADKARLSRIIRACVIASPACLIPFGLVLLNYREY